jgi:co-chaperonin GroES (HSP10)
MKAIRNQVIFKANYTETLSSGLIVPDSHKQRDSSGVVVALGIGVKDTPMEYKKNDVVYYIKNAGLEIENEGNKYFVIDDFNILAYKRTANANN